MSNEHAYSVACPKPHHNIKMKSCSRSEILLSKYNTSWESDGKLGTFDPSVSADIVMTRVIVPRWVEKHWGGVGIKIKVYCYSDLSKDVERAGISKHITSKEVRNKMGRHEERLK